MKQHQKHEQWLYGELPELVEKGVLDHNAAASLREHYGSSIARDSQNMLYVALATVGSLLVGLGIILLFAYNWDFFPRLGKTVIAFIPLTVAAGLAGFCLQRRVASIAWSESTSLAVSLGAAACIGLISQAYQISGDLEAFYAVWMWVSLPLLFAFRARSVFLLLLVILSLWAVEGHSRASVSEWVTFLAVNGSCLGFLLHARRQGSSSFLFFGYALSTCIVLFMLLGSHLAIIWPVWVGAFFATLYLWERESVAEGESWKASITGALAQVALVGVCLALSFNEAWPDGIRSDRVDTFAAHIAQGVVAVLVIGYTTLIVRGWHDGGWARIGWAFAPVALLAGNLLALLWEGGDSLASLVVNLYLFITALSLGFWGYRTHSLSRMNQGLLVVVALVTLRFFDSDFGMVARGVGFVAVGSAFLLVNLIMLKRRKEVSHV